jgi:Photosynthetic reaction centre cytochrome C subunit
MKKSLLILFGCIAAIFMFQAFTTSDAPHPEFQNLQVLPKDISKHDLDSVMHFFTASLGVRCDFCHARKEGERMPDFASDDKPEKKIARKMMLMSIYINKTYFRMMVHHDMDHDMNMGQDSTKMDMDHDMDQDNDMSPVTDSTADISFMLRTVTCYTCHRGEPHPEKKPPMKEGMMGNMPPPPPPPPSDNH